MTAAFIQLTKGLLFFITAATAIVCLYAAINAIAVYTNHTVFVSGLAVILMAIAIGPLFCFIAAYGLIY